jgi:hypothetical protein
MTKTALIGLALVAGYVVTLPALLYGLHDLAHIPGGVWRHAARRPQVQWQIGFWSAYALAGWPVIVAVVKWRRSRERAELLEEWADLSARKHRSRGRAVPRAAAEPMAAPSSLDDLSLRTGRLDT